MNLMLLLGPAVVLALQYTLYTTCVRALGLLLYVWNMLYMLSMLRLDGMLPAGP